MPSLTFLLALTSIAFFDFSFFQLWEKIISNKLNYAPFKHVSVFHFN